MDEPNYVRMSIKEFNVAIAVAFGLMLVCFILGAVCGHFGTLAEQDRLKCVYAGYTYTNQGCFKEEVTNGKD